jgi:hypothetical protein
VILAEAATLSPSDISTVIDRLFASGPYVVVGVTAIVVLWRYVVREWMDKRAASAKVAHEAESSDLAIKLKIAEAHRDTSRSLEISSKTLSDLTVKQESLITKLAEHVT